MKYLLWQIIFLISLSSASGNNKFHLKDNINSSGFNFLPKDSLAIQADSIIRKIATTNHCRVISKISRPGYKPVYSGFDGRKNSEIIDFNGPIEIGSCTKMFTATSIMQLAEKKKLSLQTRLIDILPNSSLYNGLLTINGINYIDSVRIFHLLNHSSGLPDYFVEENDEAEMALHGDSSLRFTPSELLTLAKKNKPYFIPGTGFKYSNTNYIILGMLIEKLSGMPYSQYVKQNILDPLTLKHTYFASVNPPANRAPGYYKGKITTMPATLAGPAGEIISDLDDMEKFISAWSMGSLFSDKSTLFSVKNQYFKPMSGDMIKYGLGVINILDLSLGHAGQTFGFQFYAGSASTGASFVISMDDASVSAWEPAILFSGLIQ